MLAQRSVVYQTLVLLSADASVSPNKAPVSPRVLLFLADEGRVMAPNRYEGIVDTIV
jgi:hypothetical protein